MMYLRDMVVMIVVFVTVAYMANAFAQSLRQRGHGERLDALYGATRRTQGRILRSLGLAFRAPGSRNLPPPVDRSKTEQSDRNED